MNILSGDVELSNNLKNIVCGARLLLDRLNSDVVTIKGQMPTLASIETGVNANLTSTLPATIDASLNKVSQNIPNLLNQQIGQLDPIVDAQIVKFKKDIPTKESVIKQIDAIGGNINNQIDSFTNTIPSMIDAQLQKIPSLITKEVRSKPINDMVNKIEGQIVVNAKEMVSTSISAGIQNYKSVMIFGVVDIIIINAILIYCIYKLRRGT